MHRQDPSTEVLIEAIVRYAVENGVDWICMSAVGRRGAERFFLGNTATEVLRSSPVPVLTVHGPRASEPTRAKRAYATA